MVERRLLRWLFAIVLPGAAVAVWLVPAAIAFGTPAGAPTDAVPSASRPNQQLIAFLRSPLGVATEAGALALGGAAWTVGVARSLERQEVANRVPMSKSALRRVRGRSRETLGGRPAVLARLNRHLAGLVTAAALVLPITFSILIGNDVFALPKTVALWVFGVTICSVLVALFVLGARPAKPRILELSVVAFIALTALATVTSVDPGLSVVGERLQYQGLVSTTVYVLCFIAAAVCLTTFARVRVVALAILLSSTVAAVYALVQWLGFDPIWSDLYKGRVFSTVGQANALATTLAAGAIVGSVLAPLMDGLRRAAIVGCAALCVTGLVVTFSRGGYVAFALGLVVVGLILLPAVDRAVIRRSARPVLAGVAGTAVAVALVAVMWQPAGDLLGRVAARTASIADPGESSNRAHLDLWTVGWHIALDHPVLGTGPDTYPLVFPEYRDTVLAPERAESLARFRPESPHNVYLAIGSGAGFPALAAYVVLVASCLMLGLRAARRAAMPARLLLAGLVGAATVHHITIAFMTAEPATFAVSWIILGSIAGFARGWLADPPGTKVAPAR